MERLSSRAVHSTDLTGHVYVHTRVLRRAPREVRYHRDVSYSLAALDCPLDCVHAHVAMGLNNHWDADYYWARAAGSRASLPAPGVGLRVVDGELQLWRLAQSELPEGFQTNDGKRSEWCEFLRIGDELDLVPSCAFEALSVLGGRVFAISRVGRPAGSEPAVISEWQFNAMNGVQTVDRSLIRSEAIGADRQSEA